MKKEIILIKERIIFWSAFFWSKIIETNDYVKIVRSRLNKYLKWPRTHWKIFLKKIRPKNWYDKYGFVTKTVKEEKKGKNVFKEINVLDPDGKPKKEVVSEGRRQGRWKRLRNFVFAVGALLFMYFTVGALGGQTLFKIFFPLLLTVIWFWPFWPIKEHLNKKKVVFSITVFIVLLTLFLTYPLESIFQHAVLWVLGLASITFVIEEITGKDLYPAAVVVIGAGMLLISLLLGLVDIFHDHSYYVQKTNLTVNEELTQTREWEKAKAKLSLSRKIPPGMHRLLSDEEKDKNSIYSVKKLTGLLIKNCFPAEFNRIGSVIGRIFFFLSFLTIYLVILCIHIPEIAWGHFKKARDKRDKRGKEAVGKEGLSAMAYITFDMVGSILHEFIQGRGRKK